MFSFGPVFAQLYRYWVDLKSLVKDENFNLEPENERS